MSLGGGGGGGGEGNEPLLKRAEEAAHRIGVFAAVSKGFATLSGAQARPTDSFAPVITLAPAATRTQPHAHRIGVYMWQCERDLPRGRERRHGLH
jgi:hypothetical protein